MAIKYPLETEEQSSFVSWFKREYPQWEIRAIPNGTHLAGDASQRGRQMKKLIKEGLSVGTPDIEILFDMGKTLQIEFKRQKNSDLSPKQIKAKKRLESLGHTVLVAYGCVDAVAKFKQYLIS